MGWSADSRLAERIRERVANIVLFELQDPRIGMVTITRVRLAKDHSTCRVYYSVLGTAGERSKTAHALDASTGFVQRSVAQVLRTRTVPRLSFMYDEAIEGELRMSSLLRKLEDERKEAGGEGDAGEAPDDSDGEASNDSSGENSPT